MPEPRSSAPVAVGLGDEVASALVPASEAGRFVDFGADASARD
jgi:hypothetical protein